MKTLLTFAVCLFAGAGFAANPSTKSFRATGGLVVTSNDVTGIITYDGSGVFTSSGTNATIATAKNGVQIAVASTNINFVQGTNMFLTATNSANTTHIGFHSTALNSNQVIDVTTGYFLTDIIYIPTLVASNFTNTGSITIQPPISAVQFNSNGVMRGSADFVHTNGFVGLHKPIPEYELDVIGDVNIGGDLALSNAAPVINATGFTATGGASPQIILRHKRGDATTLLPNQAGDLLGTLDIGGTGDTQDAQAVVLEGRANGTFSDASVPGLLCIRVGRAGSLLFKNRPFSVTAYQITNDARTYFMSNAVYVPGAGTIGQVLAQADTAGTMMWTNVTGGSGAAAGATGDVQYKGADGNLDAEAGFNYDESDDTLTVTNIVAQVITAFSRLAFGTSNVVDVGSILLPARTNYANQGEFKVGLNVGNAASSIGQIGFGTNFTLEGAPSTPTASVLRTWTNANPGIMVALPVAGITNQAVAVPLAAGQYLTYNGTAYVASNLPPAFTTNQLPLVYQTNLTPVAAVEAWPNAALDGTDVVVTFARTAAHSNTNSSIAMTRTKNAGLTWETPFTVITNAGWDVGNHAFGVNANSGRYHIIHMMRSVTNGNIRTPLAWYSDNKGTNWSAGGAVAQIGLMTTNAGVPFGRIITCANNRLIAGAYWMTNDYSTSAAYALTSDDDGVTWVTNAVATGSGGYGEPAFAYLGNSNLLAMTRCEFGAAPSTNRFLSNISTNNGATWQLNGGTFISLGSTNSANRNPMGMHVYNDPTDGPRICSIFGNRDLGILNKRDVSVRRVWMLGTTFTTATSEVVDRGGTGGAGFGGYASPIWLSDKAEVICPYYYETASAGEIRFLIIPNR